LIFVAWKYYEKSKKKKYAGFRFKLDNRYKSVKSNAAEKAEGIGDYIEKGNREECIVLSLKIKNTEQILGGESNAMGSINRSLSRAKEYKGKVYSDSQFKTIVFAPSVTKKESLLDAVKLAKEIEDVLNSHNKKYAQKINFGIGCNGLIL